jgi:hypothetical protein
MEIEFECKKCRGIFAFDVGKVSLPEDSLLPKFEKAIICPRCGVRSIDDVFLTELGQSQLTQVTLDFPTESLADFGDDDFGGYGFYEGKCQACDVLQPLNDLGLCEECAGKLDRDMIRKRDWAYSESAFGVPDSELENLRTRVIKHYGEKLELIAPEKTKKKKKKGKKRKKTPLTR